MGVLALRKAAVHNMYFQKSVQYVEVIESRQLGSRGAKWSMQQA